MMGWKLWILSFLALSVQAAEIGQWCGNLSAARELSARCNRPLLMLMTNLSGRNEPADRLENDVFLDPEWQMMVRQQRLAMVKYDCRPNSDTTEWGYWLSFNQNNGGTNGLPTFVFYEPGVTNILSGGILSLYPPKDQTSSSDKKKWINENVNATSIIENFERMLGERYWLSGDEKVELDFWDPLDDYRQGATELKFSDYANWQRHYMVGTKDRPDQNDWFRFFPIRNQKLRFSIEANPVWDHRIPQTNICFDLSTQIVYRLQQDTRVKNRVIDPVYINELPDFPSVNTNALKYMDSTNVVWTYFSTNRVWKETIPANAVFAGSGTQLTPSDSKTSVIASLQIFFPTSAIPSSVFSSKGVPNDATNRWDVGKSCGGASFVWNGHRVKKQQFGEGKRETEYSPVAGKLDSFGSVSFQSYEGKPLDFYSNGAPTNECAIRCDQNAKITFDPAVTDLQNQTDLTFLRIQGQKPGGISRSVEMMETVTQYPMTNQLVTLSTNVWVYQERFAYQGVTNLVWKKGKGVTNIYVDVSLVSTSHWEQVSTQMWYKVTHNIWDWQTNTLCVSEDGHFNYDISWQKWNPGLITTKKSEISVQEDAKQVVIPFSRRNGPSGKVRVHYETLTGGHNYGTASVYTNSVSETGEPLKGNYDFFYKEGVLEWAEGDLSTTNLVIDLIPDLRPIWEGDKTFTLKLEDRSDEPFPAEVIPEQVTILLKESSRKQTGKVQFMGFGEDNIPFENASRPEIAFDQGRPVVLWLSRVGGSDGEIKVGVSSDNTNVRWGGSQSTLVWTNGMSGAQKLTFQIDEVADVAESFTMKLGGKDKDLPPLGKPSSLFCKVKRTGIRSPAEEMNGAESYDLSFVDPARLWYWDGNDPLNSSLAGTAVSAGKKLNLQMKVMGPGVLRFDWGLKESDAECSWTCSGGIENPRTYTNNRICEVFVRPGKQTVKWELKNLGGDPVNPYLQAMVWSPLAEAVDPKPGNGARTGSSKLSCAFSQKNSILLGQEATDLGFSLIADRSKVLVTCTSPKPKEKETVPLPDGETLDLNDFYADEQTLSRISWRADVVISNDEAVLTRKGEKWSFTYLEEKVAPTPLPDVAKGGAFTAYRNLWCDLGPISDEWDKMKYQIVSGKLPPGLRMTNSKTGRISGVPTKCGTFPMELLASDSDRHPYQTATLVITVKEPLDSDLENLPKPGGATEGKPSGYYLSLAQGVSSDRAFEEEVGEGPYSLVTGSLPSGVKIDRKTGKLTGAPSRSGRFAAVLQGEDGGAFSLVIDVLPIDLFVGTYSGWSQVDWSGDDSDLDMKIQGAMTFTLSKSGSWSFQADLDGGKERFSGKLTEADIQQGVIKSISVDEVFPIRINRSAHLEFEIFADSLSSEGGALQILTPGENDEGEVVTNTEEYAISHLSYEYGRNKQTRDLLKPYEGYYVAALTVVSESEWETIDESFPPLGNSYLTFTVNSGGSVRWSGMLADGNKISGTSPLLLSTNFLKSAKFLVYAQPSSYRKAGGGLSGVISLDENEAIIDRVGQKWTKVKADEDISFYWSNYSPTSVRNTGIDDPGRAPGFSQKLSLLGSLYDSLLNFRAYYLDQNLVFTDTDKRGSDDWTTPDSGESEAGESDFGESDFGESEAGWFIRNYFNDFDGSSGNSGYRLVTEKYIGSLKDPIGGLKDLDKDENDSTPPREMGEDDVDSFLPLGMKITLDDKSMSVPRKKVVRGQPNVGGDFSDITYNPETDEMGEIIPGSGSVNLSNMKLSLTKSTGLIRGSFELNYERALSSGKFSQKKKTIKYYGVYLPFFSPEGSEDFDDQESHGYGFYLLPDKDSFLDKKGHSKTYQFNYSLPFELKVRKTGDDFAR